MQDLKGELELTQARKAFDAKRFDEAKAICARVLKRDKKHSMALIMACLSYCHK